MIVAVESRHKIGILNQISKSLDAAGFKVVRYASPMHDNFAVVPNCDVTIVFNGTHHKYCKIIKNAKKRGIKILYVELGWLPQRQYRQLDFSGINADASWVNDELPESKHVPLKIRSGGILVPLQNDNDTSIKSHSPWFGNMFKFLQHLISCSTMHIKVRKHPRHIKKTDPRVIKLVNRNKKTSWDSSGSFAEAVRSVRAVATINSTSGLEAIEMGYPVLCFGHAMYRRSDVSICLSNNVKNTIKAIKTIERGDVNLNGGNLKSFIKLVKSKQVLFADVATRVVEMLGGLS